MRPPIVSAAVAVVASSSLLLCAAPARAEGGALAPTREATDAPPPAPAAAPLVTSSPSQIGGGATVLVLGVGALVGDAFAIASTVEAGNCPSGVGGPADCGSAFFGELFLTIAGVSGVVGGSVLLAKGVRGAPAAAPATVAIGPSGLGAAWQW